MFDSNNDLFLLELDDKINSLAIKYAIKTIKPYNFYLNINDFDLIIVSDTLNEFAFEFIKIVSEKRYKNKLILEKPLTFDYKKTKKICNLLENNRFLIAYTRQFYVEKKLKLLNSKKNIIKWPNFYKYNIDPLKNTLPHVLDFIFKLNSSHSNIKIIKTFFKNKDLILNIMINDVNYTVTIYESNNDNDLVNINNINLEWPNYMKIIPIMVDMVLDNKTDISENKKIAIYINELLEKINNLLYKKEKE